MIRIPSIILCALLVIANTGRLNAAPLDDSSFDHQQAHESGIIIDASDLQNEDSMDLPIGKHKDNAKEKRFELLKSELRDCSDIGKSSLGDEAECREAAKQLGIRYSNKLSDAFGPKGCFATVMSDNVQMQDVWWNTHETGASRHYSFPICRKNAFNMVKSTETLDSLLAAENSNDLDTSDDLEKENQAVVGKLDTTVQDSGNIDTETTGETEVEKEETSLEEEGDIDEPDTKDDFEVPETEEEEEEEDDEADETVISHEQSVEGNYLYTTVSEKCSKSAEGDTLNMDCIKTMCWYFPDGHEECETFEQVKPAPMRFTIRPWLFNNRFDLLGYESFPNLY